jgi:hypothetical protein
VAGQKPIASFDNNLILRSFAIPVRAGRAPVAAEQHYDEQEPSRTALWTQLAGPARSHHHNASK